MFSIQRILVPFDYSAVSRAALSLALQLGELHGAEIHMVHVEERLDKEIKKRIVTAPNESVVERTIQEGETAMRAAAAEESERVRAAGRPQGAPRVITHVTGGTWFTSVMQLVDELEVDTIVVGTHGRQGLLESLTGTETEEWVEKAPCSVFVVKPQGYPYLRD